MVGMVGLAIEHYSALIQYPFATIGAGLGAYGVQSPPARLHGVNPEAYLTDVLTKLVNNWPNSRLADLTPWGWAAAH
jgi:hypothetical protein